MLTLTPLLFSVLLTLSPVPSDPVPDPAVSAAQRPVTPSPHLHLVGTSLGGIAGGLAGAGVAYGLMQLTCSDSGGGCALATILWAMPLGLFLGTPIGAWAGGALLQGHGDFFPTLVGTAAGAVAALGVIVASQRLRELSWAAPVALVLPLAGAILGYEWSHAGNLRRVQAAPLLTGDGAVGLALAVVF